MVDFSCAVIGPAVYSHLHCHNAPPLAWSPGHGMPTATAYLTIIIPSLEFTTEQLGTPGCLTSGHILMHPLPGACPIEEEEPSGKYSHSCPVQRLTIASPSPQPDPPTHTQSILTWGYDRIHNSQLYLVWLLLQAL